MSRNRARKRRPGDIVHSEDHGGLVRIDEHGEEEPWAPEPYDAFAEWDREPVPDALEYPRRADGTVAPFYSLGQDELERMEQDTPRTRRTRHDGWTIERQKDFIERLAASASVTDAARYVGMSRQSARDLYNRSAPFRAAWDEAVKASVAVLAETAFDRAVNGVQEQVWYKGRMVGFREKHDNRLLMFLLRVRDPLNFAPLDDLQGWQRHRAIEDNSGGIVPALDRLEAAEQAWIEGRGQPQALPAPADLLTSPDLLVPAPAVETPVSVTSSTSSPAASPAETTARSASAGEPPGDSM